MLNYFIGFIVGKVSAHALNSFAFVRIPSFPF